MSRNTHYKQQWLTCDQPARSRLVMSLYLNVTTGPMKARTRQIHVLVDYWLTSGTCLVWMSAGIPAILPQIFSTFTQSLHICQDSKIMPILFSSPFHHPSLYSLQFWYNYKTNHRRIKRWWDNHNHTILRTEKYRLMAPINSPKVHRFSKNLDATSKL